MLNSQYAGRQALPAENTNMYTNTYAHTRPRLGSSNMYPPAAPPDVYPTQSPYLVQPQTSTHQRQSPSANTFSTVSSSGGGGGGGGGGGTMPIPAAYRGSPVNDAANPRRSSSGRSTSSQSSSYVALLRKQKATVWSAVSQPEDPRLMAKIRAAREQARSELKGDLIYSPASGGRTSTGISSSTRSKITLIRHHGKPGVVGYDPGMHLGAMKAPLRLSATEAGDEDDEEDDDMNPESAGPNSGGNASAAAAARMHHRRTGSSGRSSTGSGRRVGTAGNSYRSSGGGLASSNSVGSGRRRSPGDTPERTGSLVEVKGGEQTLASTATASSGSGHNIVINTPDETADGDTPGSGRSSAERLDVVSDLGNMGAARLASNSLLNATKQETLNDLKRRGSVDERTVTLTTGRLFIANPD